MALKKEDMELLSGKIDSPPVDQSDSIPTGKDAIYAKLKRHTGLDAFSKLPEVFKGRLPVGFYFNGQIHNEIEIGKILGFGKEIVSEPGNQKNDAKIITALNQACILRVGNLYNEKYYQIIGRKPDQGMIALQRIHSLNMTVPDRVYVNWMVTGMEAGWTLTIDVPCPFCESMKNITMNLKQLRFSTAQEKGVVFIPEIGDWCYAVENESLGVTALMRLADGHIQERITPLYVTKDKSGNRVLHNTASADTESVRAVLIELNGVPSSEIDDVFWDGDTNRLVAWLGGEIAAHNPGPETNINLMCDGCHKEFKFEGNLENFLASRLAAGTQKN